MPRRAAVHFTYRRVARLKSEAKRFRLTDAVLPGLSIDVHPSGRKAWIVTLRSGGRRTTRTLGQYPAVALAEARVEARRLLSAAERSELDLNLGRVRFSEVCQLYLDLHAKPNKRSWKEDERFIRVELDAIFGHRPIGEIRRAELQDFLFDRAKRSVSVARCIHSLLSGIFRFAVRRDLIEASPMADGAVVKPGKPSQVDRVLDVDEIRAIWAMWAKEGSFLSAAGMLWTLTGCRKQEILGLRWDEVVLTGEDPAIEIPPERMKAGKPHRVPLTASALGIVEALRTVSDGGPWLFPGHGTNQPMNSTQRAIKRWRKASGTDDWSAQTVRRSVATWLPALGVSNEVIDVVLAHQPATRDVTRRHYNRYRYQPEARDALTRLEGWLTEQIGELRWEPNDEWKRRGLSSDDAARRSAIARNAARARWSKR